MAAIARRSESCGGGFLAETSGGGAMQLGLGFGGVAERMSRRGGGGFYSGHGRLGGPTRRRREFSGRSPAPVRELRDDEVAPPGSGSVAV